MKCPRCDGKGTQALHGIAIAGEEFNEWAQEEQDAYIRGDYDTPCTMCNGKKTITEANYESQMEYESEMRGLYGPMWDQ